MGFWRSGRNLGFVIPAVGFWVEAGILKPLFATKETDTVFSYFSSIFLCQHQHISTYLPVKREKQMKKWKREWKVKLIEKENPNWVDLYAEIANW